MLHMYRLMSSYRMAAMMPCTHSNVHASAHVISWRLVYWPCDALSATSFHILTNMIATLSSGPQVDPLDATHDHTTWTRTDFL